MLISFQVKNYRSVYDTASVNFEAPKKHQPADTVNNLLPAMAFLGANGNGKSNFLSAFSVMRSLVLNESRIMLSTDNLPFEPFKCLVNSINEPTEFCVAFIYNQKKYVYSFTYNDEFIIREELLIYQSQRPSSVFLRVANAKLRCWIKSSNASLEDLAPIPNQLFLWKADSVNCAEAQAVLNWFKSTVCLENLSNINTSSYFVDYLKDENLRAKILELMQKADFSIKDVAREEVSVNLPEEFLPYIKPEIKSSFIKRGDSTTMVTVKTSHSVYNTEGKEVSTVDFALDGEESEGIQKLFRLVGPILNALQNGTFISVDELDTSLHPDVCKMLIKLFNNKDTNPKGAQLLFTTHNSIFFDFSLLNKSQIVLVKKGSYGQSVYQNLSDIPNVRLDTNAEKLYRSGIFDAVQNIKE